jgi:hypothetical protein
MVKDEQTYNEDLKKHFSRVKSSILPKIVPSSIKRRYLDLIDKHISDEDKKIIENFIKIKKGIAPNQSLGDDLTHFKNISNYLNPKNKTQSLKSQESYNFTAWLIGFSPRPFRNYIKKKDIETKKKLISNDVIASSTTKSIINISDVESGNNTSFFIKKTGANISIKNIKSGKNTKFKI